MHHSTTYAQDFKLFGSLYSLDWEEAEIDALRETIDMPREHPELRVAPKIEASCIPDYRYANLAIQATITPVQPPVYFEQPKHYKLDTAWGACCAQALVLDGDRRFVYCTKCGSTRSLFDPSWSWKQQQAQAQAIYEFVNELSDAEELEYLDTPEGRLQVAQQAELVLGPPLIHGFSTRYALTKGIQCVLVHRPESIEEANDPDALIKTVATVRYPLLLRGVDYFANRAQAIGNAKFQAQLKVDSLDAQLKELKHAGAERTSKYCRMLERRDAMLVLTKTPKWKHTPNESEWPE